MLVFLPHLAGRAQEVISTEIETVRISGRIVHALVVTGFMPIHVEVKLFIRFSSEHISAVTISPQRRS
jgi:hypothetical protein